MQRTQISVFGTGSTADRFYRCLGDQFDIVSVHDNFFRGEKFGQQVTSPEALRERRCRKVVMAVGERPKETFTLIRDQLLALGIKAQDLLWFNQNRDQLIAFDQLDTGATPSHAMQDTLYAIYDLTYLSETYDICNFLCLAECERRERGCGVLQLLVVPAEAESHREDLYLVPNEREWRSLQILQQAWALLPSCSGISLCGSREEAASIINCATHIFPTAMYEVGGPGKAYGRIVTSYGELLRHKAETGIDPRFLEVPVSAQEHLRAWSDRHVSKARRLLTLTLRESPVQPGRNSRLRDWAAFSRSLDADQYQLVVVRDTDEAFAGPIEGFENAVYFPEASFNLMLRMALYRTAYLNLGTSNGPTHAMVYFRDIPYLIFKHIVSEYRGSSREAHEKRGIEVGAEFPLCGKRQEFAWADDTFSEIKAEFEAMISKIESDSEEGRGND